MMMTADLAFAILVNRTTAFFTDNAPVYMTYTERTRISAPSMGRSEEINRSVAVRIADNFAVMQDLPRGAVRTGQAFPVVAYFDPLSAFAYSYFANLKRIDITVQQGRPFVFTTPAPEPNVDVVVPYSSYWAARFAPDSTEDALHLLIEPTARMQAGKLYPSEIIEDPQTRLPSHIELRATGGDDQTFSFDYQVIDGHWVLVHATFSGTQRTFIGQFRAVADITFSNITFPAEAPDPRLATTPAPGATSPLPSPAATLSPTPSP
jgi:hypothetical protein